MAITEPRAPELAPEPHGHWLIQWLTTIDHKRIGILYGVSALLFFLVGGLEALVIRLQLSRPNNDVVSANTYNELFTMHGTTMIFLAIMPLSASLFNFIVPLQIGARDVAFPRLNAFSYWVFLAGGIILNMSWFFGEPPGIRGGTSTSGCSASRFWASPRSRPGSTSSSPSSTCARPA
jgi:cytochrome c oxidase subunit 1